MNVTELKSARAAGRRPSAPGADLRGADLLPALAAKWGDS